MSMLDAWFLSHDESHVQTTSLTKTRHSSSVRQHFESTKEDFTPHHVDKRIMDHEACVSEV